MTYRWVTGLADALRAGGVPVYEEAGWKTRGRPGGTFDPHAVMLHHDASPAGETSNGVDVIINGREGLPGPLAGAWLDYSGVWHLTAAGRANHAGEGSWPGIPTNQGNEHAFGIETDHTTNEQWTTGQGLYGVRGLLVITEHMGIRHDADALYRGLLAHKEWAPTRKVDPDPLDMDDLRAFLLNFEPGNEAPVKTFNKSSDTRRTLPADEWTDLKLSDKEGDPSGQYAAAAGPAGTFTLTMQAYVEGPPGTEVQYRPFKDHGDVESRYALRARTIPESGTLRLDLTQTGFSLDTGEFLRVEARADADAAVTVVHTQTLAW